VQDAMCTDKTYQRGYFYTQRNEHFRLVLSFYRLNCLPYLSTCDILTFTFSAWLRSTYFEVRAISYLATVGRPRHGACKLEMGNVFMERSQRIFNYFCHVFNFTSSAFSQILYTCRGTAWLKSISRRGRRLERNY